MSWALAKPRLLVIFDRRMFASSVISLSSYPLSTYEESVPAEQDGHALVSIESEIPASFMDGFFGYDPVENQYKVFCMIRARASQTFEESYKVFTLGDPKKQWRIIQGFETFLSPTMTTRVCINGKIYFRASVGRYGNIPKPNDSQNMLLSFDVRSERFYHAELPDQSRSLTLVNYKGMFDLGKIMPRNKNGVRLYCSCLLLY
ncbi:hypothetical protein YC2023_026030 [Brassica napus]